MNKKKVKTLISKENIKAYTEYLKKSGYPFTLKISNYTTEIVSELYGIQFLQSMRSNKCFAAYSKIKSDIRDKEIPVVDKNVLTYFNHDFKNDVDIPQVLNIDLKSAYATALYKNGVLSNETYEYLGRIPKLDRLASVGMLASKKYIFDYDKNGELIKYRKQISPLENFFYYAVQIVESIMGELKFIAAGDYLFSWVDGIYIKNNEQCLKEICDFLDGIDFKYSVDTLENFTVRIVSDKVKLRFIKEEKEKFFNIPAYSSLFANDIIDFLTSQKINKNEILPNQVRKWESGESCPIPDDIQNKINTILE